MNKKTAAAILLAFQAFAALAQNENGCIVKENKTEVQLKGSTLEIKESVDLLVTDRRGDYYTKISIPYSAQNPVKQIKASISFVSGEPIRELKQKEIVTKSNVSDFSLYEDDMVYEFEMRHNTYPYRVHFEYVTYAKNYIELCDWTPIYHIDLPTEKALLTLTVPKETPLSVYEHLAEKKDSSCTADTKSLTWQASYKPIENESFSIHRRDLAPSVTVSANSFFYALPGSLTSWKTFGDWYVNLHRGMDELTATEKSKVNQLVADCKNNREKIDKLYRFLQTTKRYINVSINIGGIKSYPAEYVCNNGYGDCKALSNYMRSLLKYVGIKSNIALIYADDTPYRFLTHLPSNQFNHVIVCVPMAADTLWLECTSPHSPAGYLGESTQNRYAFVIDEQESKIVKTPSLTSTDCLVSKKVVLDLESGAADIAMDCHGPAYENIKGIQTSAPERWHEWIIDHYLFSSFDAKSWNFVQPADRTAQIGLTVKGYFPSSSKVTDGTLYFSIPNITLPQFPKSGTRVSPICFNYPTNLVDTTVVNLPLDYKQFSNLPVQEVNSFGFAYTKQIQLANKQLTVVRTLSIPAGSYPVEEYGKIVAAIQTIKKADKELIALLQQ